MNNQRRKEIDTIIAALNDAKDKLDSVTSDEQEFIDNAPENLATSERYMNAEEAVENLEYAAEQIDAAIDALEEAKG